MGKFRIEPHGRLQEWVAEEKGYFKEEGLDDYEFILAALLDRKVEAASLFGAPLYVAEQRGFRKILDTTFMIGFLMHANADAEDVRRYFRALQRAQRDIDLEPERYKHHSLKELPERYHPLIDVAGFGPGERLVFAPYTREMYERTHGWLEERKLFPDGQIGNAGYETAVHFHTDDPSRL